MPEHIWLELLPEVALLVDARAGVVAGNRSAFELFGTGGGPPECTLTEVGGFTDWLAGSGEDTFRARLHVRRPSEVPLTVELSARRLGDGSGGAVCLVVQPDRERVASDAQRYFDIAFDAAPIGMALFNTDGEYVRVNAALCRLLGRTEPDLLGRRDQELTHPDDRQDDIDAAWRILRGEISTWQCEKRFLRPDGSVVWAIANLTFLRDEDGNPISWVGQFQDISKRRRDEKALQEALSLKSAFLDTMSHEIRTPMNGVVDLTDLLLHSDLDATQRIHVEALEESGRTLMALINDIMDFSKIEAGELDLEEIDFDLGAAVRSVAAAVSAPAEEKGVLLQLQVDDGVPAWVRGDPLRLSQILLNLAGNAVKFTDRGTVTVAVAPRGEGRLRFSVTDTGIGIDDSVRHLLLDPFSQADSSTTRRFGGTGLGLAICAQLVRLMGSTLDFDSTVGDGSTFWFELSLPTAAPPESATAPSAPKETAPPPVSPVETPAPGARVLLVDDTDINRLVGQALLKRLGCLVDVVMNGAEAVEAVRTTQYDVVLMDCLMPVMDGYEATERIRRLEDGARHTPIVALTASVMVGDRERCLASGMDDYLSKPLNSSALAGVLARCCAGSD